VSLERNPLFLLLLLSCCVFATHYPLAPGQLFSFDNVNLAYSLDHFDIRISQPQPPGYPLFVMQMRALWWLRFRRPESILLALALAGAVATLVLMAREGNRIFGGSSGFYAAILTVVHPVFWNAGITSALRVQLALISVAVGAACWRAWSGDAKWVLRSAVILGLASGIRPETGPLLFPLWAGSALRAPLTWRARGIALAAMCAAVLLWLAPAMAASGGPATFVTACVEYITDQASLNSGLFGAEQSRWTATFWRTLVWIFCGAPACVLAAVLAWRRWEGWGLGRARLAFLALWLLPALAFALLVHVEDPGQALAMVAVLSLVCGYLTDRALANLHAEISRWHSLTLCGATLAISWMAFLRPPEFLVIGTPLVLLAAAFLLRCARVKNFGYVPRWQMAAILLAPAILLDVTMFQHRGWYYKGASTAGPAAAAEQAISDITSGIALTSYSQIHATLAVDDSSLRELLRLSAERPGQTVVVWERGLTAWRKAAYYAPQVPLVVLEHKQLRSGAPPAAAIWRGPRLEKSWHGDAPLSVALPAARRIVWMLNPKTEFFDTVRRAFPLTQSGSVWHTDLDANSALPLLGEYRLTW
jgi:hypothetical protein